MKQYPLNTQCGLFVTLWLFYDANFFIIISDFGHFRTFLEHFAEPLWTIFSHLSHVFFYILKIRLKHGSELSNIGLKS